MIADQRLAVRQPAFGGVADGRRHAGIGHRHHQVGIGGTFARQQPAQIFARFLHRRGRTRCESGRDEIDVFEDALGERLLGRPELARHAFRPDAHHFARLDVVQIDRADQIERAGFRREHVAFAAARKIHFAHRQRAESVRIARHDDAVLRQEHQRKRAFQLQQRVAQRAVRVRSEECATRCRITSVSLDAWKIAPWRSEFGAQFGGVGDVAVVRHRDSAPYCRPPKTAAR